MKKIAFAMVLLIVLGAAVLASVVMVQVRGAAVPEGEQASTVRLLIERGTGFSTVVRQLHNAGLVKHPWALKVYAKLARHDRKIQWGTYEFRTSDRPVDILDALVSGDILRVRVTIPEGLTQWEIAAAFETAGVDSLKVLNAIAAEDQIEKRRIPASTLEGYLFPDTYDVPYGAQAREVVGMMLDRLDEVFDTTLVERAVEMNMTPHEVLTMASIIEAEARVPEERPLVSAVYHNRLDRGMRLEADPTVAYAMGGYRGRLLFADLEIDSPYNTYRNKGLPPGPICSPGKAAIEAALYPDSTSKALYFVARGDGSHIFSHTLKEHLAAIREVRRNRN